MGTKDVKLTPCATDSAEAFVDRLRPLGDVTGTVRPLAAG